MTPRPSSRTLTLLPIVAGAAFSLTPWASPPVALGIGAVLAFTTGNPVQRQTTGLVRALLQTAVVGLGFGMPFGAVVATGRAGLGITAAGIVASIGAGLALGHLLRTERQASWLITAGTSICGGSAIAAVGPAIGARPEAMTVALGTVFVLNAVALYLFPPIGHLLHLSQHQFAVWSALAIHDTSSVVGAAASYGTAALQEATVLKLARALWIVPVTVVAAAAARGTSGPRPTTVRPEIPWFIGLFVAAALLRSLLPVTALPVLTAVVALARRLLVLTLFLIGLGLTRSTLRQVGLRPMAQGVLLWVLIGSVTLGAVLAGKAGG